MHINRSYVSSELALPPPISDLTQMGSGPRGMYMYG